ncbi:Zinc finger, RING-type [Dillenia turbinata]|uniref:RING-type E3 ubiquitin transferase n=1 Tax=Dillenia turbinata TaxID=194707 RepID=A0AAN8VCI3_9MAGN
MIASGINLAMTVIGFGVSTMFIVFVCTRLICARIQLSASRRAFPVSSRSDFHLSVLERGLHGLDPLAVAKFPKKKYSDEYFSSSEDAQCTVCLSEYHKDDTLRILPSCGHSFHVGCIDTWLQQHSTCPVCRISLREFSDKKRSMQPMYSSAIRSHFGMEPFNLHSYHCPYNGHRRVASRARDARDGDLIQEEQFLVDNSRSEVAENISCSTDGDHITKDVGLNASGNKQVESPSNP